MKKRYWHRLHQETVDKLIADGRTWGYIMENFKQPDWCNYPKALEGEMGCWTLTNIWDKNSRKLICRKYCKNCEYFLPIQKEKSWKSGK